MIKADIKKGSTDKKKTIRNATGYRTIENNENGIRLRKTILAFYD